MTDTKNIKLTCEWPPSTDSSDLKPLDPRWEKYLGHIKSLGLSEDEELEYAKIIWQIMMAFVEVKFGVDSVGLLSSQASKQVGHCVETDSELEIESSEVREAPANEE